VVIEHSFGFGPRFSAAKAVVMRDVWEGSMLSLAQNSDGKQAELRGVLVGKLLKAMREGGREEEAAALIELEKLTLAKVANM